MRSHFEKKEDQVIISVDMPRCVTSAAKKSYTQHEMEHVLREKYDLTGLVMTSAPRKICNFQTNNSGVYIFAAASSQVQPVTEKKTLVESHTLITSDTSKPSKPSTRKRKNISKG